MHLNGVSVTFLPLDSLSKLPEKQKYFHFFNSIYCAARYSSNVPYSFQNIDYHTSVFIKTYYHCELHDLEWGTVYYVKLNPFLGSSLEQWGLLWLHGSAASEFYSMYLSLSSSFLFFTVKYGAPFEPDTETDCCTQSLPRGGAGQVSFCHTCDCCHGNMRDF